MDSGAPDRAHVRRSHARQFGRYFLEEYRPNGRLCTGKWGSDSFHCWDDATLRRLLRELGPNEIYIVAHAHGIDWEQAVRGGSGYGVYSRYFDSLQDCATAVNEAIVANQWYTAQDEALKRDRGYQKWLRESEARASAVFNAQVRRAQAAADVVNHGFFQGCANLRGPLDKETQRAILAYLNAPSERGWN